MCDTVDPLGGSYYVETLTNQLEEKIVEAMDWVESVGGIVEAVDNGIVQAKVSRQAYQRQKDLESGAIRKVGMNCYQDGDEEKPEIELHGYDAEGAYSPDGTMIAPLAVVFSPAPPTVRYCIL